MGTLFDYLKWRGDLSFRQAPINEVDSLIFSLLSYVDFTGIVSSLHESREVLSLRTAANGFFSKNPNDKKISMGLVLPRSIITLLKTAKETLRFRNVGVKAHVNRIDLKRQMQFSATTFLTDDGNTVVVYRGTDDTLIGWKENFNMSFMESVPAQREAVAYLDTAAKYATDDIYVMGHSKGGNLAIYATVFCKESVRERLARVWSHDGPGFCNSMLNNPTYLQIRPIIRTLIPESSVVGILLEHEESYTVIKSKHRGPSQHNGMTWDVAGPSFVHLQTVSDGCKRFDRNLNAWIKKLTMEQREQLADAIYQILSSNDSLTLSDLVSLKRLWHARGKAIDPQVYAVLKQTVIGLIEHSAKNLINDVFHKSTPKSK